MAQIAFDPLKDQANRDKHGISLALAAAFEWNGALVFPDARKVYGEDRMIAYGVIGNRLHCLVYTMRGNLLRAISLRKANQREVSYVRRHRIGDANR